MSQPTHNIFSESSCPEVTLRRDHDAPFAPSCEWAPLMVPARRARLIADSALARLALLAGCASVWLVVAVELLHAAP